MSPSNARSCPDVSAPRPQTIAVWLSAVVDMGEPVPSWTAHQATSQLGGLPGMILYHAQICSKGCQVRSNSV